MENGEPKFFHGTLEATIFKATMHPRPNLRFQCLPALKKPAYVIIKINHKKVAKTLPRPGRVWNQTFQILCAHPSNANITITLKTKHSVLGKVDIPAQELLHESSLINGFFPLEKQDGKPHKLGLKLQFILWFKPARYETSWNRVLEIDGGYQGLRNAAFPMRSNCGVVLYQDAHHSPQFCPPLDLCGEVRNLWEDIYLAIDGAKYLVYIAGWSLNPRTVLVRDSETGIPHAHGVQLGELLKRKAEEGVAVRIMLWNDETSLPIIKNKGVMKTHDEDAHAYFHRTKVVCKLCPRLHKKFPTAFAHHQKTITVDARTSSGHREIVSFIGGFDLCDGRYDTNEHPLFKMPDSNFHDFYQSSIHGASLHAGGPRQPWHDTHACITGEVARDVLVNFEQRWTKQCNPSLLVLISSIKEISNYSDPQHNWRVQVFRSIDHASAMPMPKNLNIEKSIHEAYVDAIRRADRFIYIENQYFIGGCHMWEENKDCGCRNLIPIEIALKVAAKIRTGERFAVYVVMPLWPEGEVESEAVQDILHWTRQTMKMMYRLIGMTMEESRVKGNPNDYLNFFCLGNREPKAKGEYKAPRKPHTGSQYWSAQKNRRFMIYVHSKLMIVDDTYLLIGSANVNQRSMDGQRDTEIAIGCHQLTNDGKNGVDDGDIRAFRMSLWYEHTGQCKTVFEAPHTLECVHSMQLVGDEGWRLFSGSEMKDLGSVHLMSYPVKIGQDGCVEDACKYFPDTKTTIKGNRSKVLLSTFTT